MIIKKGAGLKKVKVDIGKFLDPPQPSDIAFITFSGPTVGEYNDLMATQMEMAKEDPEGIEMEIANSDGTTRKMKISTQSAKKRTDAFNAVIEKHIFDHNLDDEAGHMSDAAVWKLVTDNAEIDAAVIEAWSTSLPLAQSSAGKPGS